MIPIAPNTHYIRTLFGLNEYIDIAAPVSLSLSATCPLMFRVVVISLFVFILTRTTLVVVAQLALVLSKSEYATTLLSYRILKEILQ